MKYSIIALSLLGFSLISHAGIFGEDDRINLSEATALNQKMAQSVAALVYKDHIQELLQGYELKGKTYQEMGFCSDEKFVTEKLIANCSASLVGPKTILTAAHCFNDYYKCEDYKYVFDYVEGNTSIAKKDVYSCKKVIFEKFVKTLDGDDIALIELDREVEDREPIKLNFKTPQIGEKLTLMGFPYGLSLKIVEVGEVTAVHKKTKSFRHNLDSFSVNSGGPIFNKQGEQVGVLVRGTGPNYENDPRTGCKRWGQEPEGKGWADGNLLGTIKSYMRKLKK